jgi:hypothetical protein
MTGTLIGSASRWVESRRETSVGVEPTQRLFCRQPPDRPAPTSLSVPARNRTWSTTFAGSDASGTPRGLFQRGARNVERGTIKQGCLLFRVPSSAFRVSSIPTWTRTRTKTFGGSYASITPSGPMTRDRNDWIRTRLPVPRSALRAQEGRRRGSHPHDPRYERGAFLTSSHTGTSAGAQGFEPCAAVLEAACSPRSTPLFFIQPGGKTGVEPALRPSQGRVLDRYTTYLVGAVVSGQRSEKTSLGFH